MLFPPTIAGSLPKPGWLAETEKLWPKWKLEGAALDQAKRDAALIWVKLQEDAGIETVTDGEQFRTHFVHGFLETVEGIDWTWTTWAEFLREVGHPDRHVNVRRFNSYVIALQAARSGQGVTLGWESLVAPLIETGNLVRVTDAVIAAPQSYFVTWSARRPLSPQATLLRDWLLSLGSLSSAQASRLPISLEQPARRRSPRIKGEQA